MNTKITELFGIQYPIILSGMSWISVPQMVAAVSEAGGLGLLATGPLSPEETRQAVREIRSLTAKPFGANLRPDVSRREGERQGAARGEGAGDKFLSWQRRLAGEEGPRVRREGCGHGGQCPPRQAGPGLRLRRGDCHGQRGGGARRGDHHDGLDPEPERRAEDPRYRCRRNSRRPGSGGGPGPGGRRCRDGHKAHDHAGKSSPCRL